MPLKTGEKKSLKPNFKIHESVMRRKYINTLQNPLENGYLNLIVQSIVNFKIFI